MKIISNETKKTIINTQVIILSLIGTVIAMIYACQAIQGYGGFNQTQFESIDHNPCPALFSLYTHWIGGMYENITSKVFYIYIVFASSLSYAFLYINEHKKENTYNNTSMGYRLSKYVSNFVSSGLIAAVPLIINLFVTALFIPANVPDSRFNLYYPVFYGEHLSELFYTHPVVYEFIYILSVFVLCGLLGCFTYYCAMTTNNRVLTFIIPILFILFCDFNKKNYLFGNNDISPISYITASSKLIRNYSALFVEIVVLFLFTFISTVIGHPGSKKNEGKTVKE